MNREKQDLAENALKKIALREGIPVSAVRESIYSAMLAGLCSSDDDVQAYWRRVPCDGSLPTPEELIVFLAEEIERGRTKPPD